MFWAEECKTVVNEEFSWVYKIVEKGKADSEFLDRLFRKLSWIGSETINGDRCRMDRRIEGMEEIDPEVELTNPDIILAYIITLHYLNLSDLCNETLTCDITDII